MGAKSAPKQVKVLSRCAPKSDIGKVKEPREPNECLQLDFWGPIKYLNESSKYVLVSVDQFSRRPTAMICGNKGSYQNLKFKKQYSSHHGMLRKIFMDQGCCFTSKVVIFVL